MEQWLQNMDIQDPFILEYNWIGNLDIDLSALLVSEEKRILIKEDLVYYNSRNRSMPYDKSRFRSRQKWIDQTHPISIDGSVELLTEEILYKEENDSDCCSEYIKISLSKVRPEISNIKFVASIYDTSSNYHFGMIKECQINLLDDDTLTPFTSYDLMAILSRLSKTKAIVFAELSRINTGKWDFNIIEESFIEGLSAVVDSYV